MLVHQGSQRTSAVVRIVAVVVLCAVTPITALLGMLASEAVGVLLGSVVPLGCAVGVIATAPWSRRTRIVVAGAAIIGTIVYSLALLSQASFAGS